MPTDVKPIKVDRSGRMIPKGATTKVAYWRVTLGKKITGGKKQRRYFKTYKEAVEHVEGALAARIVQGQQAVSIPGRRRGEAMEWRRGLEPPGGPLTAGVGDTLRTAMSTCADQPLGAI